MISFCVNQEILFIFRKYKFILKKYYFFRIYIYVPTIKESTHEWRFNLRGKQNLHVSF